MASLLDFSGGRASTPQALHVRRAALESALKEAANQAQLCKAHQDGPASSEVQVTFALDGTVKTVNAPPSFSRTERGKCVIWVFSQLRIPPFTGEPFKLSRRTVSFGD
jgi:hypothetical protein